MLERIAVRDFALIEAAHVELPKGLVLFSGETGAGKSLVVGAIGFLFGARADTDVIREGAAECSVSGTLDIEGNQSARRWLEDKGIECEDASISLRRGIRANGRSYAWIGGAAVTRADLAEFTALVCDIHGQHEHQSLLKPETHIRILDRFGGLEEESAAYAALFGQWAGDVRAYRRAAAEAAAMSRELDFLAFSVQELKNAHLQAGEDERLAAEEKVLSQHEKLFTQVESAGEVLLGMQEGSALAGLRHAKTALEGGAHIDPRLAELSGRLSSAYFEIEDIAGSVRDYLDGLRFDPVRLEAIQARQAELRKLKKKYGATIEEMLCRFESDKARLKLGAEWDQEKASMEAAIAASGAAAQAAAQGLSEKRKEAARRLTSQTEEGLFALGMPHARFSVSIAPKKDANGVLQPGVDGIDAVEFLIAPNPGEPEKALAKIASGGELARVALAVKTILAEKDNVGTLIFDEIDSGIGGEIALAVGLRLKELAKTHQVLCVTHLASIAAIADTQYRVSKEVRDGRTLTLIDQLEGPAREEEIARMLSGDAAGEASRAHAAALLAKAAAGAAQAVGGAAHQ